jgi:hypothetical protein
MRIEELCIDAIRCLFIDAIEKADSGHPGAPMALAQAAFALWTKHLSYNPRNPFWFTGIGLFFLTDMLPCCNMRYYTCWLSNFHG